jgi:hypothetical protein
MTHPTRIFKKPEEMLKAWDEYKDSLDFHADKWAKVQYVGKDGVRVTDNPPMPYTVDGFCSWFYRTEKRFIHQYFKRTEELYPDFLPIVTHIENERNENIKTGVLTGHFNSNLGTRIVGAVDKKETELKGGLNIPPLPDIGER